MEDESLPAEEEEREEADSLDPLMFPDSNTAKIVMVEL